MPRSPSDLDFPAATMRKLGRQAVAMVARHVTGLRSGRVGHTGTRSEMRTLFEEPAPRRGRAPEALLRRIERQVMKYSLPAHHPRFFGFIPSGACFPGVLGDLLASGFNVFNGTWMEAPGPAQIELTVLEWFRQWLGMPATAGGVLLSGGSAANLTALVAARETAMAGGQRRLRERAILYFSEQAHSSVERAARVLDIPAARQRPVKTDAWFRLSMPALAERVAADRRRGLRPWCVVANAGSTNTGSIDPLLELARFCRRERLWLHVDAAYGGFAILTRRGRSLLRGIGGADSITLDPHKWLFAPYDVGCLLVRDRRQLRHAFTIHPEYLQDIRSEEEEVNFYEYCTQLTRAFRALKVWLTVQTYGTDRLGAVIEGSIDMALRAEARLAASPAFEILSPASLGIVCFRYLPKKLRPARLPHEARRHAPRDSRRLVDPRALGRSALGWGAFSRPAAEEALLRRANEAIVREVQERARVFFTSTILRGRYALRLCILSHRTRWSDVELAIREIERAARRLA